MKATRTVFGRRKVAQNVAMKGNDQAQFLSQF